MTTHQNQHTHRRRHSGGSGSFSRMIDELMNSSLGDVIDSAFVATRPFVNVFEKDDAYELHVAAPGLQKSDFKIEVRNGMLQVSAGNADQKATTDSDARSREFDFSQFSRTFRINDKVDPEHISARYDNGILVVRMQKRVKDSWNKEIKID